MPRFTDTITELYPSQTQPLDPPAEARVRAANPDTAAQAQQLAGETGLAAQIIERNLPEVQQRDAVGKYQRFLRDNPSVLELGDEFHTVAKDDTSVLQRVGTHARNMGRSLAASYADLSAGLWGILEYGADAVEGVAQATLPANPLRPVANFIRDQRQAAQHVAANVEPYLAPGTSVIERGVHSGIRSLGQQAPMYLAAAITRNPNVVLGGLSAVTYGQSYAQARERGLSTDAAAIYSMSQATIEYATEKIPAGKLIDDLLQDTGFLKMLTGQLAAEIPGEQVATIFQDLNDWAVLNPEKPFRAYLEERPEAAAQTLVATIVGTAGQTSITAGVDQLTKQAAQRMQADVEAQAEALQEFAKVIEASKLRERSPEQFKRFVENVAPDAELYVDAADLQQALEQGDFSEDGVMLPDDINERIAEAAEHDTPVKITAAEFATYFADQHTAQFLSERVRVGSPDAMNVEEAKNIESEFKARADQVMETAENNAEISAQAAEIRDTVRAQITSTGRFRNDVANAYAGLVESFFVSTASRLGVSPSELFARYPIRVQADVGLAVPDETLEQPAEMSRKSTPRGAQATFDIGGVAYTTRIEEPSDAPNSIFTRQFAELVGKTYGSEQPALELDFGVATEANSGELLYKFQGRVDSPSPTQLAATLLKFAAEETAKASDRVIMVRSPVDFQDKRMRLYERALRRTIESHEVIRMDDETLVLVPRGTELEPVLEQRLQPVASRAAEAGEVPRGFTRFRHFGNYDVSALDPSYMGTGMKGEEGRRAGPRVISLYPDTGFQKETGVGGVEYVVDIPTKQLYDTSVDPLNLADEAQEAAGFTLDDDGKMVPAETRFDMDKYEQAIKDAGYVGYITPTAEGNLRGQARIFSAIPVVGGKRSVVEETDALFQLKPENEPEGFHLVTPYLTESERDRLMKNSAAKLVSVFKSLPKDADFEAAARAGGAKRGWYARATQALRQVFGEVDAPRFAALLAATSPQVSVQTNLQNAALIWAKWDEAGRPAEAAAINDIIDEALGGAQSVLGAWRNNSVRALVAEDATSITLSGPKVNSFMRNLMGDMQEVTNDTWMANFAAVNQILFKGDVKDPAKQGPGKRPGYVAYAAKIRRVADKLGWTPAEVQETVWSWAKTAYELAEVAGETRSVEELVRAGEITDARVAGADDFASMLKNNESIRNILEAAGYGEAINAIEAEFGREGASENTARADVTPALLRSARRLDQIRRERREESERGSAERETDEGTDVAGDQPLVGLPSSSSLGPIQAIRDVAKRYVEDVLVNKPNIPPQTHYVKVNPERATRYAQAYEAAKHDPNDFEVAIAYDALIDETVAQFQLVKELGIKIDFIEPGQADPYPDGPRQVHEDLRNGHLWVFPTDQGFGQTEAPGNPLLRPTQEIIGDRVLLANDVFRIVHDVFGHGKEGVGFGPTGEENAYQAHVRMYSPLAARAMTSETRGQNSWVNFGPHGEANRSNQKATVYAEQKATLLPEWVTTEGLEEASGGGTLEQGQPLEQQARGQIRMGRDLTVTPSVITLFEDADLTTFLHESGHFFLEVMADLSARPDAPAAIRADMETLLKWFGYKGSVEEWRALSIPERRTAHEKFARGFEAWLLEGKAPNDELRGFFHRFRAWLLSIYKRVESLNVQLSDEVRSVMSNMLATQEQIAAAEEARAYAPLFDSQEQSGMTDEQFAKYREDVVTATQIAEDELNAKSLRNIRWLDNARARKLKELQSENADKRAAVQAEVEAELDRQPVRIAERLIVEGKAWVPGLDGTPTEVTIPNHKLAIPALEEAYGTREEHKAMAEAAGLDPAATRAPWQDLPRRFLAKEGMAADEAAALVGMSSGDQLIGELLKLTPREQVVEQMTDQRVMEQYGDLNNPQTLARAADEAVHNQHRMRVVSTELAALDKTLANQKGGMAAVRRAARDYAARVVQGRKIRDVRPGMFTTAEAKAAREAQQALAAGDLKLASARKRDQLFNGYAARDASRALNSVDKGLEYLKRLAGNDTTRRALDPVYRDQIDRMLERFDLRRASLRDLDKRATLAEWIKDQEANGTDPVIPEELRNEAMRTNYKNLTVEQFQGLVDSVKNIEHLARLKSKLLAAKEQRDFDTVANELVTSIEANALKGRPKQQLERDLSLWGRFSDTVHEWLTHLRKMGSIVRQIDGVQDGGKMWEYFMRPINAASDKEVAMRAAATKRLNTLLDMVPGLNASFEQRVKHRVAGPPRLFIPAINTSLTLEARLAVALNWGNDGNRERIMEGNKWTESQVQAIIDTLSKPELDFVQATLDFIGEYWSEIAAKEERVTGVRPERVEARPINTTNHGTYRGGYYPIVADPLRSDRAAQQNDAELIGQSLRGAVTRATTRRGHTKERVGGKDPVRLDLGVITKHVTQVVHDLSWHEVLIDSGRLLRDSRIAASLRDNYGAEVTRLMRKTLDDVARGEVVAADAGERFANYFRVGTTIAGMGFSVTTALLQPTGITQSFVRVGYRHVARGLIEFVGRPFETIKRVRDASPFMRDRGLLLNRELGEITNRLDGKPLGMARFYFMPIQALQTTVDIPTWLGAYNKAQEAGESHDRAVALADQAVRDSQSTGAIQDLAETQRGGAWKKLWTNFYSYFSATYQLSAESVQRFKRDRSTVGAAKMAADFLMLYTVPAFLGVLLREGLRGDIDDEEELAEALLRAQLSAFLGVFPYVRELSGIVQGFDYRGPAGANIIGQVGDVGTQLAQGENDEALWRAVNRAAGTAFHYPAAQVDRTVRGVIAVTEGEAGPQALLVGPPAQK